MAAFAFVCLVFSPQGLAAVYLSPQEFISQSFTDQSQLKTLWLNQDHQQVAKKILGHPYRGLRIRYWQSGLQTAWILDEIGKDKPITIGVIIRADQIQKVTILEFRESRGGEVRHPFFTRQFKDLFLKDNNKLSGRIDGISGATLSVRAVSNVSRYALYLHKVLHKMIDPQT